MTQTLNILKPSVNNLTVRIFMRAAALDCEEVDVWGKTMSPEYMQKYPAHLTPMLEAEGLPRGALGESCAIMQYLCNKHGLTQFYPTVARATYPTLNFAQYAGEVATSEADDAMKTKAAKDAESAIAEPLEVYNTFFLAGRPFIGGDKPSIADFRLAATLEFLKAIDYDFPAWADEYMSRMEETLGDAYSEPAGDVRGYIEYVRSPSG
jgi:glutathione S-transferase